MYLRNLNVRHSGRIEGAGFKKMWRRGHTQWHGLLTDFHNNLPIGSKLIKGGGHESDGQAEW
jgi:hypothetical protein